MYQLETIHLFSRAFVNSNVYRASIIHKIPHNLQDGITSRQQEVTLRVVHTRLGILITVSLNFPTHSNLSFYFCNVVFLKL